ncbi:MAG: DNA helicase UvrD, partial [Alphaproteobacteria bacterium HGW-Alphaproteobacteria-5]
MDAWANIRLKARACHADALATSGGDRHARALVAAAVKDNGLEVEDFGPEAGFGNNVLGFVERASQLVNVARGQAPEQEAVVIAHEIGHFLLHTDPSHEVTMVSPPTLGGDPIESGAAKVQGYSSRERKEVQADVFAGEFLCPSDWLRVEMVENGRKTTDIASELGLPSKLVLHQAIRALLLPPLQESEPEEIVASHGLDESQAIAATWAMGPLMVDAGPGTGKTRTLIHRVGHILDQQVSPASILALTFSNKAAEEMRIRLSATHPDAAIEMWVGTFHAFGMELIAKWADRVGRTDTFQTFDEAGSLELLERNLARLPLKHFQNLYDPAFELIHVLRAISRCKDELIDPDQYLVEAERALALAPDDESVQRAVEVGRIYKIYEEALLAENAVDFGDLVRLPVKLLQDHPDIRQHCHQKYAHILVDEYQDVNLASARLLRLLVNEQRNVWVVADQRQSIYRFRGAKPANVAQFAVDFSG